jgi:hypothetical protein
MRRPLTTLNATRPVIFGRLDMLKTDVRADPVAASRLEHTRTGQGFHAFNRAIESSRILRPFIRGSIPDRSRFPFDGRSIWGETAADRGWRAESALVAHSPPRSTSVGGPVSMHDPGVHAALGGLRAEQGGRVVIRFKYQKVALAVRVPGIPPAPDALARVPDRDALARRAP